MQDLTPPFLKTIALGVMLLMILVTGCRNVSSGAPQEEKTAAGREAASMTKTAAKTDSKTDRPPLDLAAPAKTATATFALG
jgi:hypothetical protein